MDGGMMMATPPTPRSACVPVAMPAPTVTPNMAVPPTMTPPREYQELVTRAVCQSAAIEQSDVNHDPVNYWIGMWGKLIILVTVKRQGFKQQIDPEELPAALDWEDIFLVVSERTPLKMRRHLNISRCTLWVERRVKLFRECFPAYNKCGSILDKLARHYAKQLMNLNELQLPYAKHLHWENFHEPPVFWNEGGTGMPTPANHQLTLACLPTGRFRSQSSLLASSFCSFGKVTRPSFKNYSTGSSTGSTPTSINPSKGQRKVGTQNSSGELRSIRGEGMETTVDASRQLAFNIADIEGRPNVCLKIYAPDTNQKYSGHFHAVFEHGSNTDSSKAGSSLVGQNQSRKRELDSNENEVHQHQKQMKIGDLYSKAEVIQRDRLLVIFNRFKTGPASDWMRHMAWILGKNQNPDSWECEYSFGAIEEKIKNFEIADFQTLMDAFRCLVAFYLLWINDRKIHPEIVKLQRGLKIAAECSGIYPSKDGETWRGL